MNKMCFSEVLDDNYERFNVHITRLRVIIEGIYQNLPSNAEANYNIDFFPIVQMKDISNNLKEMNSLLDTKNKPTEPTNLYYEVRNYITKIFEMVDEMIKCISSRSFSSLGSLNNQLQKILAQYELNN